MTPTQIEKRLFGKINQTVTRTGLGGEGILRTHGRDLEAQAAIQAAIDQGITYFDSARVYADSECYYGSLWGKLPDIRSRIFQASKSASRDRDGATADL
ncbi:MAG: aldo/keto reductase, partial [Deltaproteobacteria bacterium]|nr:aldo/keto reductase [Deltaproteobacteria bacterium]